MVNKMSEVIVKQKDIVVPGEHLAKGMDNFPGAGTFRDTEDIYSARLGVVYLDGRTVKVIPLSGVYIPKSGDTVIGKVIDIAFSGWRLDTNSPYSAMLSLKDATSDYIAKGADLTEYFNLGDYLVRATTDASGNTAVTGSTGSGDAHNNLSPYIVKYVWQRAS